ncbi:hypothetical protein [Nocardia miyunensis]|uniref:hypothetical protein n=1 Tax=Nocardia miyunensis TaxID=282684 RepID=UPI0012F4C044|nr:hypothetical protein [Nocardia miyunensis]
MAVGVGVVIDAHYAPDAAAKPINPYVQCPQWQEIHPGWPCWGNFPEIEEPTLPGAVPGAPIPTVPTPQPVTPSAPPSTTPASPPAAALTPPPPRPAPDPCKAIVPVPGYVPPALPGHAPNAPCSGSQSPHTPRELIEPYVHPACSIPGIRILSPEQVHDVVTDIVGPLEAELGSDDPYVRSVIDEVNSYNKTCSGGKDVIEDLVWNDTRDQWYNYYRERFLKRNKQAECDGKKRTKDCEGLVAVCYKQGEPVTPPLTAQRDEYITGVNSYIRQQGYPAIRIPVKGTPLERSARRAADQERRNNPAKYPTDPVRFPNGSVAGHVPDTAWSGPLPGKGQPYKWAALDSRLNSSIGGQAGAYPQGYRAIAFVPGTWGATGCEPADKPYPLAVPPLYGP